MNGYKWEGMKKITLAEAEATQGKGVFLLYPDNTEGMAVSIDEIRTHVNTYNEEIGIEKEE